MPTLIEIKARCSDPDRIRRILREHSARFVGADHQVDTYFNLPHGRLKLREGNIENALIFYRRPDQSGPKQSDVLLYPGSAGVPPAVEAGVPPASSLKQLLTAALGIRVVVEKTREIYFIHNVKFHLDEVRGLGSFVEIEAIGREDNIEALRRQCDQYLALLAIRGEDLLTHSYSDML